MKINNPNFNNSNGNSYLNLEKEQNVSFFKFINNPIKWLSCELNENSKIVLKPKNKNWDEKIITIIYKYQQNISSYSISSWNNKDEDKFPNLKMLSPLIKPDIFIKIESTDQKDKYIIFDAKYSNSSKIKTRFNDIYKYKSWILDFSEYFKDSRQIKNAAETVEKNKDNEYYKSIKDKYNDKIKPIDIKVIALYPWIVDYTEVEDESSFDAEKAKQLQELFEGTALSDDIWFWAFVVCPKKTKEESEDDFEGSKILKFFFESIFSSDKK